MTIELDPYGALEWAIGSGDDFVCFDYYVDTERKEVHLASTLNSDTAGFIQKFEDTRVVSYADDVLAPYNAAMELTDEALDWAAENDAGHDEDGWNQDPRYFARCVHASVTGTGPAIRKAI